MAKKIGYIRARYPEKRNIIGRAAGDNEYVQLGKWHNRRLMLSRGCDIILGKLLHRQFSVRWNLHAVYRPLVRPGADILHTFNAVCDSDTPWVCTFETAVPRTEQTVTRQWMNGSQKADRFTKKTFRLLAKDSCKALISLSESSRQIQLELMEAYDIADRDIIAEKIVVLPPPQERLITDSQIEEKYRTVNDCVEFIFVGGDFFRKGGAQIIDSLSRLAGDGRRFHLTLISTLNYGDYASHTSAEDMQRYREIIDSADWITYYDRLPNPQVLELCKKAHVGLLPTLADTYGYSVLEMQACGCPVVTTDVRALPEMNNEQCGYICTVPKHRSTEAKFDTEKDLEMLKKSISDGLDSIFTQILAKPSQLTAKAFHAAARIDAEHSPEQYAQRLTEIYDRALGE